jgi:uncharacterized lipoprotein YehR (DUF1307 family)
MTMHMNLTCTLIVTLLLLPVVGCASEESKQMKQLSGTYALTSNDTLATRMMNGVTLTLRPDGRWTRASQPDTVFNRPAMEDSGTYRANGSTIAIRSDEGPMTYVVKGDTLMWQTAEKERRMSQTEAITGVKMVGQVETFYVRVK